MNAWLHEDCKARPLAMEAKLSVQVEKLQVCASGEVASLEASEVKKVA